MSFHVIYEDPSYEPVEADFYYDLDDEGNWVEVQVDADGNPIVPETYSPFDTVNS
mgnify:CR=1 FL=1